MNLPLGRSPKLSAHLDRITRETEQLDRELDAAEARKRLSDAFNDCVRRYLQKAVPTEAVR